MIKRDKSRHVREICDSLEFDMNSLFETLESKMEKEEAKTIPTFDYFAKIWKEMDFSMIHAVYATNMERSTFLKFIFGLLISHWIDSRIDRMKAFILYTLFSIFISQPSELNSIKIQISIPIFKEIQEFAYKIESLATSTIDTNIQDHEEIIINQEMEQKEQDCNQDQISSDVLDLFCHLTDQKAFSFVAKMPNFKKRKHFHDAALSKQTISIKLFDFLSKIRGKGNIFSTIQKEIFNLSDQYERSKIDLPKKLQNVLLPLNSNNIKSIFHDKLSNFTFNDCENDSNQRINHVDNHYRSTISPFDKPPFPNHEENDIKRSASAPPLYFDSIKAYFDMPSI